MFNVVNGSFSFICAECNLCRIVDLKGVVYRNVSIKCICGNVQKAALNYRKTVRVTVPDFKGIVICSDRSKHVVRIEDISIDGAKLYFQYLPQNIAVDDILSIKYTLTDNHKTVMMESLRVVRIDGHILGVQTNNAIPYSTQLKRKYFWISSFIPGKSDLKIELQS